MKHLFFVLAITCISACSVAAQNDIDITKLKLEQLTVVSRHNVRAPLQKNVDSTYNNVESKDMLMEFTVPGSHLTERGATLETIMGMYFRGWLKSEGLLNVYKYTIKHKQNSYSIDAVENSSFPNFYFAASPRQRTVVSTRAFISGLLHGISAPIYHQELESKDPDFLPYFVTYGVGAKMEEKDINKFIEKAQPEVDSIINQYKIDLNQSYKILMDAVNYSESKNSKWKKEFTVSGLEKEWCNKQKKDNKLKEVDLSFFRDGKIKEPEASGTLKAANQISDALILQYLEMDEPASTGLNIPPKDSLKTWRAIADIKDIYSKILFTAPMVAVNTSHRLLCQVKIGLDNNTFTFLCTHDTSISALLKALRANDYSLPESLTIEGLTPNGCKLCIEKYSLGKEYYGRVRLLYQSTKQVRNLTMLDYNADKSKHPESHPQSYNISFEGLKCVNCNCDNCNSCRVECEKCDNCKDGCFYKWEDLMKRIDDTIAAFAKVAKGEKPF